MKTLLLLSTMLIVSSCGLTEGLDKNCGSDIRMGCNLLFGTKDSDQDSQIAEVTFKNNEQDAKIASLQNSITNMISNIDSLTLSVQDLENTDNDTYNTISALQSIVNANTVQLLSLATSVTTLNGNLTTTQGQLTALTNSLSKSIVDFKDPCGNGVGYDEILMKTKDGKFIAYFEDGGNRFLSILENGTYRTTDQSRCYFTVNNGVISNEHY